MIGNARAASVSLAFRPARVDDVGVSLDGPSRRIIAEPADAEGPPEQAPVAPRPAFAPPTADTSAAPARGRAVTAAPPLIPSAVYGLRTWTVAGERGSERLAGPHRGVPWPAGGEWLEATCEAGHAAPASGCNCGLHAWHPRRRWARRCLAARGEVPGIVEARGTIELHHDGLRGQRARPYALVRTQGCNPALLDRLATAYGLPIVDARGPDDLLAYCRERGLGLSEHVVASLLGPRRARAPAPGAGRAPARERGRRRRGPDPARDRPRSEGRAGPVRPDGAGPRRSLTA